MIEKKVALIGSAPSSVRLAPYHDPSWEIWGVSPGTYGIMPRVTAFFELHLWEPGVPWLSPEYVQWLKALPQRGVTLWTGAPIPDIPGASVLPADEILAEFDPCSWFPTSSLFWMMAMAMKQGATKIGMWGVDMAATSEYELQRAGIHYMTYIARQRGIEVGVPHESDVFTPRFKYGVDEWTHGYRKNRVRRMELEQRVAAAQAELQARQGEVAFLSGALDDLKYQGDTWMDKRTFTAPVDVAGSIWAAKEREIAARPLFSTGPVVIPEVKLLSPGTESASNRLGDTYLDGATAPEAKPNGSGHVEP